jgi:hypothetical protein
MKLIATYCAKAKATTAEPTPAYERYLSKRITHARDSALINRDKFAILSGRFGLIDGSEMIPYYDHLLQEDEIPSMIERVAETMRNWGVSELTWYSLPDNLDPFVWRYRAVITRAAAITECSLKVVELFEE